MRVFNVDISRKGISPVVQVTEHDAMSRFFTLVLRDGAADYEEPEGATYSVWYKTADSHGWYDTITEPDEGTHPAVVADGNEYTIEIAEQATTSCGELALCITAPDGYQLTVSGIITRSDDIPGYDGEEVENYYNVFITEMRENAARAENAADIAVAYGATVEVDEDAQQLNITHHSDTEGGVGWLFGSAVASEASGSVAAFADGANDVAVKSLVAEITPVQSGSGDPSPTNVRAISGRTGLNAVVAGRNLLDGEDITLTREGTRDYYMYFGAPIPAGTYTFSCDVSGGNGTRNIVAAFRKTGSGTNYGVVNIPPDTEGRFSQTVTVTDSVQRIYFYISTLEPEGTTITIKNVQVETGETALPFTPYIAPNTYSISWQTEAGTVYGGTLDVVSGVLTVTGVLHTLTGEENFGLATNSRRFTAAFTTLGWERANTVLSTQNQSNSRCSHATYLTGATGTATPADYRISTDSSDRQAINFYDTQSEFASAAAFNAYLAAQYANGTPVQLYYELATPLEPIQLSPTEIKTLLGGNTVYTDAGAVSVEYVADTKLYIDNKIAELQALVLEN